MTGTRPHRIAITAGEPAGIGPDLCIKIAQKEHEADIVVIADPQMLQQRAECLGLPLTLEQFDPAQPPGTQGPGCLRILPRILNETALPGKPNPANAAYVLDTLRLAANGCMNGDFSAMVTAPVHKGILNSAGFSFTGHTEFLAELGHRERVVMMLATKGLRVALVTTHMPLRQVCNAITPASVEQTLRITAMDLQKHFGIKQPRLLVCGLNPHAGENGHLGSEEIDIIIPVMEKLCSDGMQLTGPLPADTAFIPKYMDNHDVFVAMYHDQGLPVLKHRGFGNAINVTLGLPFIRTSVDHGTALELAGSGDIDDGSMNAAVDTALYMARQSLTP